MHLFLTDRIACPRCGPDFGLILMAHEVRERRVLDGELGCPNCREKYPIRGGFGDLRFQPRPPLSPPDSQPDMGAEDPEETLRMGALLGVTEGPGTLLIMGPAARHARGLARLIGGVEVVAMAESLMEEEESEGVSRLIGGPRLPFFSSSFSGVLLSGEMTDTDLEEAARVAAPLARIVILEASPEASGRVEALGLEVLLQEKGVLVAQQDRSGSLPLVTLRGP
jgi:uncharacterized protein YbaR (Trm112 family)